MKETPIIVFILTLPQKSRKCKKITICFTNLPSSKVYNSTRNTKLHLTNVKIITQAIIVLKKIIFPLTQLINTNPLTLSLLSISNKETKTVKL
jgi:hypothetical protein